MVGSIQLWSVVFPLEIENGNRRPGATVALDGGETEHAKVYGS
jgi:hypothetical protein